MNADTTRQRHWTGRRNRPRGLALCAIAALALAATAFSAAWAGGAVTPEQAQFEAASTGRILIDVRSPQEWRATGLPAKARTVTIHQRGDAFLDGILAAVGDDKNQPIALICATGVRSMHAQRFLEGQGFTNVMNVEGGLFGAPGVTGWVDSGLPMEACKRC